MVADQNRDSAARRPRTQDALYGLAQRFARRAGADLAAGRADDSMANAGIALEHLAKAYLMEQHRLLVVGSRQGEIDLAGMRWALSKDRKLPPGSRTINATEAIRRSCALVQGLDERVLRPVLDARNGVLHIGQGGDQVASRVIAAVAQAAERLLPEINHDPQGFWGHYYDAVTGRLDERRTQVAHRVADQIASAREGWDLTSMRLGAEGVKALKSAADRYHYREDEEPIDCPACESESVVSGIVEVEEEPEVDHDGPDWFVSGVSLIPFLDISGFNCLVCGLQLDGSEEIAAAGLPTRVESRREIDPAEYYGYGDYGGY